MRINLGDVALWFDVSGPSAVPRGGTVIERPAIVAVHGGPGSDHINMKAGLAPLADHFQILYYDQRGHGRSDRSSSEFWNLRTWASDLKQLCDMVGLVKPVVLGSSFGGHVVVTYAGLFPGHAVASFWPTPREDGQITGAALRYSAAWVATRQLPSRNATSLS